MQSEVKDAMNPMYALEKVVSNPEPALLHAEGMQIDVEKLCYGIQVGNENTIKNILHEVSFRLRPGSMCALMGPSGSGKR